jgi:hypothetical protein
MCHPPDPDLSHVHRDNSNSQLFLRIEQAGRQVLRRLGRDRFTTQDVAVEAQMSIGTVYRYFCSREDLLDHLWPDRRDTFPVD